MEALGINIVNVFIYIILFLILYRMLDKLIFKKLSTAIDKRKEELEKGLTLSGKVEAKLAEADKDAEQKVSEAVNKMKIESEQVLKDAKAQAKEIISKAEDEASLILKNAKKQNDLNIKKQKEDYKNDIEAKAKELLKAFIKEDVTIDKKLIDKYISENF